MTRRAHIPLKTKLAAALLTMLRPDDDGNLVPVIPHEDAKAMSDDQIISLFHFDHDPIPHAHGGPDEAWNLTPRPLAEHRIKTAKRDIPQMAKTRRLSKAQEEFRRKILERPCGGKRQPSGNWPRGRKIKSRGFEKRISRTSNPPATPANRHR